MDRQQVGWRARVANFAAIAAVALVLAVVLATRGRGLVAVVFLVLAAFESWRAYSAFRDRPVGPPYDEVRESDHRTRRLRSSAIVITVATAAELVTAAVSGLRELWLLAAVMTASCVLVWVVVSVSRRSQ